jgi:hypothetical protein
MGPALHFGKSEPDVSVKSLMRLTKHKNWRRVSSLKNHHSEVTYFVSEEHITCPILKLTGRRPYDAGLS